jgi:hypothetical protein
MDRQTESEELDARASERLLEMLAEHIDAWRWMSDAEHNGFTEMRAIVSELRGRGDTLVRGADLRLIAEARRPHLLSNAEQASVDAAWQRIDDVLGRVL